MGLCVCRAADPTCCDDLIRDLLLLKEGLLLVCGNKVSILCVC